MDDVLCNYSEAHRAALARDPGVPFPQSVPGFFTGLAPMPSAISAIQQLRAHADLYILSAPSTRNPHSYTEKRLWIEQHFDYDLVKRLILSPHKGLLKGDYLIDDRASGKGQDVFEGMLIHFGTEGFPDWPTVLAYFRGAGILAT